MFRRTHAPRSTWTHVPSLKTDIHARTWFGSPGAREKSPIVLVHGLGLSSRYMVPLGRRLSMGYDVLAPDMPGFGSTPKPADAPWPAGPDIREQAEQLVAWMDACGIRRATLFGNSIGVQVAVEVAVRYPERVDRLVLGGPTPDPQYRSPLKQYPRVVMNMPFEAPSLNSVFQLEYASAGVSRMTQQLRRSVDDPIEQRLPQVQAPALVIRGRFDQTLSQGWAEEFTRLLPNGRLVVIEGAAHNFHYSAPHVTVRVMRSFLEGRLDHAADATEEQIVVPGPDHGNDPLAPSKPISTRTHGMLDYLTAAFCVTMPKALGWGPRTQTLLTAAGVSAASYSLFTDYELGAVRKIPMPVHLNIDAASGMEQLLAAAFLLRGEPPAGRWTVAALGLFHLFAANATHIPMGPARLIPVGRHGEHDPAMLPEAAPVAASAARAELVPA